MNVEQVCGLHLQPFLTLIFLYKRNKEKMRTAGSFMILDWISERVLEIIRGSEWGRGATCRLKFHHLVDKYSRPLSFIGKSQLIFLSLVDNCFPRFVGSQ